MSHINIPLSGGNVPVQIPTEFDTQSGNATTNNNIIKVDGFDSAENNVFGITTKGNTNAGNPPGTGTTNEVSIYLTNRLHGTSQTVGATSTNIITAAPTVVGTYVFEVRVVAYNTTSLLGAGYELFGAVRFDGANFTNCDIPDKVENEEGAMNACNATITASGGTIVVTGTGYALQTINWAAVATYTFIGA